MKNQESSLADFIEFIQESWKQLFLAGVVGLILGLGGWFFFGKSKAELILQNNTINNNPALDLVSWRILQKSLPNLADQFLSDGKVSAEQVDLYRQLREPSWWSKNVIVAYASSKMDIKDFSGIPKDLSSANIGILSFTLVVNNRSKDTALRDVNLAAKFLKTGGAFLQIKSFLNEYTLEILTAHDNIQDKISETKIQQIYLLSRLKNLKDLLATFPTASAFQPPTSVNLQIEPKYLPLITQIIGTTIEVNENKESLMNLNERLNQISLIEKFIVEARPLADQEVDGILLLNALMSVEGRLRKNLLPSDIKGRQTLDELRKKLRTIEARFTLGIEENLSPTVQKTGALKATAGGIFGGAFLMLAFLLGRKTLRTPKPPLQ